MADFGVPGGAGPPAKQMEVTEPSPGAGALDTAAPLLPGERHLSTVVPPPQQPLELLLTGTVSEGPPPLPPLGWLGRPLVVKHGAHRCETHPNAYLQPLLKPWEDPWHKQTSRA